MYGKRRMMLVCLVPVIAGSTVCALVHSRAGGDRSRSARSRSRSDPVGNQPSPGRTAVRPSTFGPGADECVHGRRRCSRTTGICRRRTVRASTVPVLGRGGTRCGGAGCVVVGSPRCSRPADASTRWGRSVRARPSCACCRRSPRVSIGAGRAPSRSVSSRLSSCCSWYGDGAVHDHGRSVHGAGWSDDGGVPIGGKLSARSGPKTTLLVGCLIIAPGYTKGLLLTGSVLGLAVVAAICSTEVGFAYGAMPALIMGEVPATYTAAADSVNSLMRLVGTSSASAVLTVAIPAIAPGGVTACRARNHRGRTPSDSGRRRTPVRRHVR